MFVCRNIMLTVLILLGTALSAPAADHLQKVRDKGQINWTEMRISATGLGAPPENAANSAQARAMSKRAAVVVARRNLLEVVKHVRIDSKTLVKNYMVKNDRIQSRVKGVLKHSSVDKIVACSGGYKATVSVPLTGKLSQAIFSAEHESANNDRDLLKRVESLERKVRELENLLRENRLISKYQNEMIKTFAGLLTDYRNKSPVVRQASTSSPDSRKMKKAILSLQKRQAEFEKRLNKLAAKLSSTQNAPGSEKKENERDDLPEYTGLIVDARGLGFKPCMRPRIFAGRGKVLYPGQNVSLKKSVSGGYARFYRDLGAAQQSDLAGDLPLTSKAKNLYLDQSSSVVIPQKANEILKKIASRPNNFLKDCRVIFVF